MSWSISSLDNAVKVSAKVAKEVFEACGGTDGGVFYNIKEVSHGNKLYFNPDHSEWMDYLQGDHGDKVIAVLKENKVKGDITFGSLEGDNSGLYWGYRFDGKGGMVKLTGTVIWTVDEE